MTNQKSKWVQDIHDMHTKFSVRDVVSKLSNEQLKAYLKFRLDMVQEEVTESFEALNSSDADGVVDALIDNIVFSIGTLDAFGVNADEAWDRVHAANMDKSPGIKEGRPNPFGFPDLIKGPTWKAPTHVDNTGLIDRTFKA